MALSGMMYIAGQPCEGSGPAFHAQAAVSGALLAPAYREASAAQVAAACLAAEQACDAYRGHPLAARAAFLEAVAEEILALGDELIVRCMAETGLPRARLEGERGRTMGQLRLFAEMLRKGEGLGERHDPALPDRAPAPRPDLRMQRVPLGPVAVFGASNFPLAFSVAGGDTASALAAGCPVIVKAHPAHPGTSELVGLAITRAAARSGMPAGVFSLLHGAGHAVGAALVADGHVQAVGFTGSRAGGLALMRLVQQRPVPIPVYAEMSAINPVVLMPGALAARAEAIGQAFVASLVLGAGQFCTNPGLILGVAGPDFDRFEAAACAALRQAPAATMLTPAIAAAYGARLALLEGRAEVALLARGAAGEGGTCAAALFATDAQAFLADAALHEETFGAAALLVRCADQAELLAVLRALEGQLTAAVHAVPADYAAVRQLMPVLERKVGRILFDGFGTGVEVAAAMVHGGPFPASSDSRTTSVGTLAIERFWRPVCYQDMPAELADG
ncbi:MAG TPA: aldehyde dehydrogenase (NADP(+)) [Novosphingobium sp.]|nr:aldehyde dehydrogenase (NADP(+)) [Novosphingobium sp.]